MLGISPGTSTRRERHEHEHDGGAVLRRKAIGQLHSLVHNPVSREARPDAEMAEIRGFSAEMERVKGIEPSYSAWEAIVVL